MSFISVFKPNVTALGFALFLAINAASVWGGSFPFLPDELQSFQATRFFFVAQALVFGTSFVVSVIGVYFFPGPTRRLLVWAAGIPYFIGWACLITAMYVDTIAFVLVILSGALLGLGSAGFYMLWQRLFAGMDSYRGSRDLILGTAYSAILYFSLYLIPRAVTALLIPLVFLPLFALCINLRSRSLDKNQPMFEDIPREHPKVYRHVLHSYWRSALSIGAVAFSCGIVRSLAINSPDMGSLVNVISMVGSLVSAVIVLLLWQKRDLRINVTTVYRVLFPFIITAFFLMAFLGEGFSTIFAGVMYAFYSCGIMLMMLQCAQASRDHGINPVFIYGFFGAIVYILHDVGFISGMFAESFSVFNLSPTVAATVTAMFFLALMYFVSQGGFHQIVEPGKPVVESIELMALNVPENRVFDPILDADELAAMESSESVDDDVLNDGREHEMEQTEGDQEEGSLHKSRGSKRGSRGLSIHPALNEAATATGVYDPRTVEPQFHDRVSLQCSALQSHYHLSARETEIVELLARGNSMQAIADTLVVSNNTIRTHAQRIYAKLNIHKKQELIELVNSFDPAQVN